MTFLGKILVEVLSPHFPSPQKLDAASCVQHDGAYGFCFKMYIKCEK